jgi:glycosyltransferase involved in cell wall biosynthesis
VRVLHLIHSFPPETRGGVEAHVEQVARVQMRRGRAVRVLAASEACPPDGELKREDHEGIAVSRFAMETDLQRMTESTGRGLDAVRQALDDEAPDLLHVHHLAPTGPGVVALAAERGIPSVVSLHDLFTVCPLFFRLRRDSELCAAEVPHETCVQCLSEETNLPAEAIAPSLLDRDRAMRADLERAAVLLAQSNGQAQYLRRVPLLDGLEIECIGFPAAPEPESGPVGLRLPDLPLRVATWGGLVRGKGLHTLVAAVRALPPETVELHHFGRVIDEGYAEQLRAEAGYVPLTFHGAYRPDALSEQLADIDLAVFPSLYLETYGLVTDEALRLGLPVIVPDRGAPRERLGARGVTYRVGDSADLATVLDRFVQRPERLLALRAGEPGPFVETEAYVDALDAVYDGVQRR